MKAFIDRKRCCANAGRCTVLNICPVDAIHHNGKTVLIDTKKCTGCGICATKCCGKAVAMVEPRKNTARNVCIVVAVVAIAALNGYIAYRFLKR